MMCAEKKEQRHVQRDSLERLAADLVAILEGLATSRVDGDLLKQQANTAHHIGRRRLRAIMQDGARSALSSVPAGCSCDAKTAAVLRRAAHEIHAGHYDGSAADLLRRLCKALGLSVLDVVG